MIGVNRKGFILAEVICLLVLMTSLAQLVLTFHEHHLAQIKLMENQLANAKAAYFHVATS